MEVFAAANAPQRGGCPNIDAVTVLVVDAQQALAEALGYSLALEPGVASVRACADPTTAAEAAAAQVPDVVVIGTDGGDWDYARLLGDLRRSLPAVAIVAISADSDATKVAAAVRAGATSWVPKQAGVRHLASVVVGSARGEAFLPADVLFHVLRCLAYREADEGGSVLDRLTVREGQVLDCMSRGVSRSDIAARLSVSVNTVRTHVQHILTKLEVHTALEAVTLALQQQRCAHSPDPDAERMRFTASRTGARGQ